MAGHENLSGCQPDQQKTEPQLPQPKVAEHARQIIEGFTQSLKKTPKFVKALADHYFDSDPGFVVYRDGDSYHDVLFRKELKPDTNLRTESLYYHKTAKNPDGSVNLWQTQVVSVYRG